MATDDALRWNKRYADEAIWSSRPREWLIDHIECIPTPGIAIDLAMGLGENSRFLINCGWKVLGVDISSVAIKKATRKTPEMLAIIADLDTLLFAQNSVNLILNFYYLNRKIIPWFQNLVKPGGFIMIETITIPMLEKKPEIPVEFLLRTGELRELFSDWNILDYREGWFKNSSSSLKSIASIFAQYRF